jgi:polyphosphate kinase 2 (PPK2 family)
VKAFLHLSRAEQGKRLRERIANPEKAWKFRRGDLDDRARWDEFMRAYDDVIGETSTEWAPWYVVPADHNWVRNVLVARIVVAALQRIDPQLPPAEPGLSELEID